MADIEEYAKRLGICLPEKISIDGHFGSAGVGGFEDGLLVKGMGEKTALRQFYHFLERAVFDDLEHGRPAPLPQKFFIPFFEIRLRQLTGKIPGDGDGELSGLLGCR